MHARGTQTRSWIAIYAVALHTTMLGVVPSVIGAQSAQFDPFSVICHGADAASSSDRTHGQPDFPQACEHCNDYVFEPAKTEIKSSNAATIAVRLLHKSNERPVTDAVIVQTRIVMAHDGGAEMSTAFVPLANPEPGVYAFMAPLTMAGSWFLSISAKVPGGGPETVVGKITFRVTP